MPKGREDPGQFPLELYTGRFVWQGNGMSRESRDRIFKGLEGTTVSGRSLLHHYLSSEQDFNFYKSLKYLMFPT